MKLTNAVWYWLARLCSWFRRLPPEPPPGRKLGVQHGVEDRLLIFEHIPKTGGTTFHSVYLPLAFDAKQIFILNGMALEGERDRKRFTNMPPEERARIRVVAGHGVEPLRAIEPEACFLSMVRDPVQRVTSAYLHTKYHRHWTELYPSPSSLSDFVENFGPEAPWFATGTNAADSVVRNGAQATIGLPNLQSRILLGEDYRSLSQKEIERRLDNRYLVVGITERYPEFLYYLHKRLHLPLALFNKTLIRAERASVQFTASELDLVRRANEADIRLYDLTKRRFDQQFSCSTSGEDIEICSRYRDLLEWFSVLTNGDSSQGICVSKEPVTMPRINLLWERLAAWERSHADLSRDLRSVEATSLSRITEWPTDAGQTH